jgi:hypothetical protein
VGESDYSTAHPGSDPNYLGDVSNDRLGNGWSWEVRIWRAGGGDRLQHGAHRIGPKLFGEASMEGNAVVRWEFGHVGDGLRAAGGLKYQVSWCI